MEFMKMALPTDMVQNFEKHLIQKDYNGFKYVAPVHYKKRILNYAYETVLKNWELVTIKAPDGSRLMCGQNKTNTVNQKLLTI